MPKPTGFVADHAAALAARALSYSAQNVSPATSVPHKCAKHKVWWTCVSCAHDYDSTPGNTINLGQECPFCGGVVRGTPPTGGARMCPPEAGCEICTAKSVVPLLPGIEAGGVAFLHGPYNKKKGRFLSACETTKAMGGRSEKAMFQCLNEECGHAFDMWLDQVFTQNHKCPYCTPGGNRRKCPDEAACPVCLPKTIAAYVEVMASPKNGRFGVEFVRGPDGEKATELAGNSNKVCTFRCLNPDCLRERGEYDTRPYDVIGKGTRCNSCSKNTSAYERACVLFLKERFGGDAVKHLVKPDWLGKYSQQSFDALVELLDARPVVVEIDGEQHFKSVLFPGAVAYTNLKQSRAADVAKAAKALENGFGVVRVPMTIDAMASGDWKSELSAAVRVAAASERACIVYCDERCPDKYALHRADLGALMKARAAIRKRGRDE